MWCLLIALCKPRTVHTLVTYCMPWIIMFIIADHLALAYCCLLKLSGIGCNKSNEIYLEIQYAPVSSSRHEWTKYLSTCLIMWGTVLSHPWSQRYHRLATRFLRSILGMMDRMNVWSCVLFDFTPWYDTIWYDINQSGCHTDDRPLSVLHNRRVEDGAALMLCYAMRWDLKTLLIKYIKVIVESGLSWVTSHLSDWAVRPVMSYRIIQHHITL